MCVRGISEAGGSGGTQGEQVSVIYRQGLTVGSVWGVGEMGGGGFLEGCSVFVRYGLT